MKDFGERRLKKTCKVEGVVEKGLEIERERGKEVKIDPICGMMVN